MVDNNTEGDTLHRLLDNTRAAVDLSTIIMIGIAFAALMVLAYIIFEVRDQLLPEGTYQNNTYFQSLTDAQNASYNTTWNSIANVTGGWDDAVNLLLVAITIFILAIAISALLMLRGR